MLTHGTKSAFAVLERCDGLRVRTPKLELVEDGCLRSFAASRTRWCRRSQDAEQTVFVPAELAYRCLVGAEIVVPSSVALAAGFQRVFIAEGERIP